MKTADPRPLMLGKSSLIAAGLHRECHRHPLDENLCVKVVVRGNQKESRREQKAYRLAKKRIGTWETLPRFHGEVPTNLGAGAVFDLIRDADGSVSRTLEAYLTETALTDTQCTGLILALRKLRDAMLRNCIVTMTIKPKNLLWQRASTDRRSEPFAEQAGRLVIVDNIGNSDFIPLADYVPPLARQKIRRKWRRFIERLAADQDDQRLLAALR